jgi:hypothetical protein
MRAMLRIASIVSLSLLLAGCSSAEPASMQSIPPASEVPIEAEVAPPDPQEPESSAVPKECSLETQSLMAATIESQTSAFADEDFEKAYSFASPSFRSNVNIKSFVAIIAGSYGPLIVSTELAFADCVVSEDGSLGVIEVRFVEDGSELYAIRYLMVLTQEGWRVEAATELRVIAKGS